MAYMLCVFSLIIRKVLLIHVIRDSDHVWNKPPSITSQHSFHRLDLWPGAALTEFIGHAANKARQQIISDFFGYIYTLEGTLVSDLHEEFLISAPLASFHPPWCRRCCELWQNVQIENILISLVFQPSTLNLSTELNHRKNTRKIHTSRSESVMYSGADHRAVTALQHDQPNTRPPLLEQRLHENSVYCDITAI